MFDHLHGFFHFAKQKSLPSMYYRHARAAILVYDITNQSSFDNGVKHWIEELKAKGPPDIFVIVVGNKIDAESRRVVSKDIVETYVESVRGDFKGIVFRECSAKTGEGVQELFEEICRGIQRIKGVSGNDNVQDN